MADNTAMRFLSSDLSSSTPNAVHICPLQAAHVAGLMQVQEACYGAQYMESAAVYQGRVASAAQCSWVAVQGGQVLAYAAAYRSRLGSVTPLHGAFGSDATPDTLYLHDMAVHPDCAGQGVANAQALRGYGDDAVYMVQRYRAGGI